MCMSNRVNKLIGFYKNLTITVQLWEESKQKDKNWYCRWSYEPQFKGKVRNFDMGVKSLAGLESPKKKSMFGNAKLINLSVMQVF